MDIFFHDLSLDNIELLEIEDSVLNACMNSSMGSFGGDCDSGKNKENI